MIMVLLPLLFFILSSVIYQLLDPDSLRESILKAFLTSGLVVWLSTEFLSLFDRITIQWIQTSWILFNLLAVGILVWLIRKKSPSIQEFFSLKIEGWKSSPVPMLSLVSIALISGITLLIALKAPPNNFDSMTYHMARVSHWIQNASIRYFPTAIPRQNYSMPLAEYGILHLQLLSRSDQYANLIQWISFGMAILTSSLLAKQLKLSSRAQWFAAALTAALPMAILQSSSTQNDLVVGVFCLGFLYFLGKLIRENSWIDVIFSALAMGLALGTKGTAYIYCAGIGISLGGLSLLRKSWEEIKQLSLRYIVIIAAALALNTGIYIRNYRLYRHPLITSNERVLVDRISGKFLAANLVRNSVMNLASPIPGANRALESGTIGLLGFQADNPASTFQDTEFEISFSINEDQAGNGLHLIVIMLSALALPWLNLDHKRAANRYVLVVTITFLLYCLAFKWQPWGGRLQTPLFLMATVLPAAVIDRPGSGKILPSVLLGTFLVFSIPYLLLNTIRPVLPFWEDSTAFYEPSGERKFLQGLKRFPALNEGFDSFLSIFHEGRSVLFTERKILYFMGSTELLDDYNSAAHRVRNIPATQIGLLMDSNQWEYPLWVLLNVNAQPKNRKLFHVLVDNPTKRTESRPGGAPELILVTQKDYQDLELLQSYQQIFSSPSIQIFQLLDSEN